jgi:serine/threonine protein kinase/Tol biopolymer transport system component
VRDRMTPERWRQVTEVFHAALARDAATRAKYLEAACEGDRDLRVEVDAMLMGHAAGTQFGEGPLDVLTVRPPHLAVGATIGAYRIDCLIAAGGMGEVYRAHDTSLGRDVAIKVLPAAFTSDTDRLVRFEREARLLASLNHANIAAIYGLEQVDEVRALILELVEGPTLEERIAHGPLPIDEALQIARQVAGALGAAHVKGIVHRDLKPGNIKVRPDGTVKVLDFGLAKRFDGPLHEPHITSPARMTGVGVLLGTASYMAPEQALAQAVDRRADIWAFGCVLYEMVTGRRAFAAGDLSNTLAAVLGGEVDWDALPEDLAPAVAALLRRCLDRDRRTRVADVSIIQFVLDETPSLLTTTVPARRRETMRHIRASVIVPWVIASALVAAILSIVSRQPAGVRDEGSPMRLSSKAGADILIDSGELGPSAVLSPDGRTLAFTGGSSPSDRPHVYVRALNQLKAVPLAGTEGAFMPFFSPDGRWVGFFAAGKLKKISITGGAVVTLCDAPDARGGFWDVNGTIVFQPERQPGPLMRVREEGGKPDVLFKTPPDMLLRWPQLLPGSDAVLFTERSSTSGNWEMASIVVQPLPGGEPKVLVRGGFYGRYVSSGHLLYMHDGTMLAAPMNLERLELTGPSVEVVENVSGASNNGNAQFAVSDSGTAVYVPEDGPSPSTSIQWMDSAGHTRSLRGMSADWSNPAFSPDGRTLAMDISDGAQTDIWTYDWARETLRRMTFDRSEDVRPIWSADGSRVTFSSKRGDNSAFDLFDLYWVRADETGEPQRLTTSRAGAYPGSWHPSGRFLAYAEWHVRNGMDLMILPMDGDENRGWKPGKPYAFLATPFVEEDPQFSPDGRWIAYNSNESGRSEIYVRPFPGPGGKWQVSSGSSADPIWSRVARQLFFVSGDDQQIMVAPFKTDGDVFRAETPRVWASMPLAMRPRRPSRDLDLHPDGKRFAVAAATNQDLAKRDHVVLIFNFFDELRRLAPPEQQSVRAERQFTDDGQIVFVSSLARRAPVPRGAVLHWRR